MADFIGLKVFQKTLNSAPSISPANFTALGAQGEFERGIPNIPVKVTGVNDVYKRFGNPLSDKTATLVAIQGFYNAAPYSFDLYLQRLTSDAGDAVAASYDQLSGSTRFDVLKNGTTITSPTITITAGTNSGRKVVLAATVDAVSTTETYDDLEVNDILQAINYGNDTYDASAIARITYFGGIDLTNVASTSIDATNGYVNAGSVDITIEAGQLGYADPGVWGNTLGFKIEVDGNDPAKRKITPYRKVNGEWIQQDDPTSGLTYANTKTKMDSDSYYFYIDTLNSGYGNLNPTTSIIPLTSGANGTAVDVNDYIGSSGSGNGVYAFAQTNVTHLTHFEELSDSNMLNYGIGLNTFLSSSKPNSCLGILNVNGKTNAQLTSAGFDSFLTKVSYICGINGFQVINYDGSDRQIPAVGGLYGSGWIKKMFQGAGYPHVPPGGQDSALINTKRITTPVLTDSGLFEMVKTHGWNPLMQVDNVGFILRTTRTFSTDNNYYDIHKRRSVNFISQSLLSSLGFVEQTAHTEELWNTVIDAEKRFFNVLYSAGMFHKENGFDGSVVIVCDATNNTPSAMAQRKFRVDNTLWIVDTIEAASINIFSTDSAPLTVQTS